MKSNRCTIRSLVVLGCMSIFPGASAAEADATTHRAPPPSEWPVQSLTLEATLGSPAPDFILRFQRCVSRGKSLVLSPSTAEKVPLGPSPDHAPSAADTHGAPVTDLQRGLYWEAALGRAELRGPGLASGEHAERIELGTNYYLVLREDVTSGHYLAIYIAATLSGLLDEGFEPGGTFRTGIEVRPSWARRLGTAFKLGFTYDSLNRFLANQDEVKAHFGMRLSL